MTKSNVAGTTAAKGIRMRGKYTFEISCEFPTVLWEIELIEFAKNSHMTIPDTAKTG